MLSEPLGDGHFAVPLDLSEQGGLPLPLQPNQEELDGHPLEAGEAQGRCLPAHPREGLHERLGGVAVGSGADSLAEDALHFQSYQDQNISFSCKLYVNVKKCR